MSRFVRLEISSDRAFADSEGTTRFPFLGANDVWGKKSRIANFA